nr:alpha/beta hydrolase [Shewanella sp. XMDDZSB0408]
MEALTLPLTQIELAAVRLGDGNKPILLCIHGWLDNLNSFIPLNRELEKLGLLEDYQIICIDLPGHGLSAHRFGHYPLHWVDYIYDLHSIITHLSQYHKDITVIGHSMGGIIACCYNATFPNSLKQLILIEAISPLFESETHIRTRLKKSLEQHLLFNQKTIGARRTINLMTACLARNKLTGLELNWCELITKRNLYRDGDQYYWRSDPRLKLDSLNRMSFEQVEQLMNSTGTPSLLVLGEQGYKQLKSLLPKTEAWFTDLTVAMLPGDHHLHMSHAQQVAIQIRAFTLNQA